MPDWSEFEKLSGENDLNFENLCKGLIILHYERFGRITALSSQAGVEFYIELHHDCVLGKTGQTIGWQCKWYDKLSRARAIGNARQKKIADGISKTIKHYPNIDRWVLWTKYNLTSGDHTWYKKQTSSMILDHKHEDYVDLLLHGDGSLLRESYFGDLIMSRSWLNQTHDLSTSQVQHRWLTHLHQVSQAEKKIRKHLCEPSSWKELSELRFTIEDYRNKVREVENQLPDEIQKSLLIWHDEVDFFVSLFERQFNALNRGCLKGVTSVINELRQPCSEIAVIPRRLRAAKSPLGMYTTNIKAFIQDGIRMLKSIEVGVSTRIVAVIADAGGGKTQLAAEISARTDARSAGLLLLGKHLNQGDSIDQLVQRISLNGKPLQNIESLVAGLNSEGERQQSRLPLIIDGLNESERPSDWKDILSQLYELLKNYPYVLVICTVRSGIRKGLSGRGLDHHFSDRDSLEKSRLDFAEQSLPEPLFNSRLEMNAFDSDPDGAIDAYLKEYKIDIGNNALPWVIKSHPLSLRIFCEACNPTKETVKIVESIPQSMFLVFNEYVENTSTRICELSKSSISVDEVKHALFYIGNELWQNGKREVDADALRNEIGDISRNWLDSILPLMEQEGLILINPGDTPYKKEVSPSFDALGGYYIANSLFPS